MLAEHEQIHQLEQRVLADASDNGHSLLSPSGSSKWMQCRGSMIGLHAARTTGGDSVASIEGTLAHYLLEASLLSGDDPMYIGASHIPHEMRVDALKWFDRIQRTQGNTDDVYAYSHEAYSQLTNGDFPEDMRVEIRRCWVIIQSYVAQGWTLYPELRMSLKRLLDHSQCDGTSDVVLVKGSQIIVADLKYGKGVIVHAEDSKQLMLYAMGAISTLFLDAERDPPVNISLVIMQPRVENRVWEEWDTTFNHIMSFIQLVRVKSIEAMQALAEPCKVTMDWFNPSESACKWCHRKLNCAPRLEKVERDVVAAFSEVAPNSTLDTIPAFDVNISDDRLASILAYKPFIDAWFSDAEKEALRRVQQGRNVGGRKMVEGRKRRGWYKPNDVVAREFLSYGIPAEKIYDVSVKSPAKMEKVSLTSDQREFVQKRVHSTKGQPVMALSEDSRKAVTSESQVLDAFASAGVVSE